MTDREDSSTSERQVSFEESLERLDRIVARLEGGEVGLEEALRLFEDGQRHAAHCRERLAAAKQRIEEIAGAAAVATDTVDETAEEGRAMAAEPAAPPREQVDRGEPA